jgi:hypothetical protein
MYNGKVIRILKTKFWHPDKETPGNINWDATDEIERGELFLVLDSDTEYIKIARRLKTGQTYSSLGKFSWSWETIA